MFSMNMKKLLIIFSAAMSISYVAAQTASSEECLKNISMFTESVKNKQFVDAVEPWEKAYAECPNAHLAIYQQGVKILEWQLSQTKDPQEISKLRDRLMELYDNRIKYFGSNAKYPTSWILGEKAVDYIKYSPEDKLKENAYGWLETSIKDRQEKSSFAALQNFVLLSMNIYKARPETAEKFISDYMMVSECLDKIAAQGSKMSSYVPASKDYVDHLFVSSGAADCATMDNIFRAKVAANQDNITVLNQVCGFYEKMNCKESEVYFSASLAAHKIAPSAKSASGCAAMCFKNKEFTEAIKYFEEACTLSDNDKDKANYEYMLAYIYYSEIKNYPVARSHARKSAEYDPTSGRASILVAHMYAASKPYDDPVLNKTVYWVAVDELRRAKQTDPTCAEEADKYIALYSRHFPTTEEIFFQPELGDGKPFTVGGWIGVSTTCR